MSDDNLFGDAYADAAREAARAYFEREHPDQVQSDDQAPDAADEELHGRRIVLTSAADIEVKRVHWLWADRIALGTLALLAGPEGLGKSTLAYWLAARITRGELEGEYQGQPRSVLVCAAEDSWSHTIVPRLMAHDADLSKVFRVEVVNRDDIHLSLSLPSDLLATEQAAKDTDAVLLITDPLMSRLADNLDTHKDGDVRRALEPLVTVAERAGMAVLGVIHHNKSGTADPLNLVMASKAFTAVARSVHSVIRDPDDETEARRLFGTPKNNLGRLDLPTMSFTIAGHRFDTSDGEEGWTGRLVWGENAEGSIGDALRRGADQGEDRSATTEAADWLQDWLVSNGGTDKSANVKQAAKAAGHPDRTLARARQKLRIVVGTEGFPRVSWWSLPGSQQPSGANADAVVPASRANSPGERDNRHSRHN